MSERQPVSYVVRGVVEHGDERGRTIGFPTANLAIERAAVVDGVWSGWVARGDRWHMAAISVGNRPTFYGDGSFRLLEAHLLDFDDDLYGEELTVVMCQRLRGQVAFESVDHLVEQLRLDVEATRRWCDASPVEPAMLRVPAGLPDAGYLREVNASR